MNAFYGLVEQKTLRSSESVENIIWVHYLLFAPVRAISIHQANTNRVWRTNIL